ncbi:MAG TPA: CheR family methyltransferase [Bryobacteraceae bacterium]|nr:CheR family methyltransferase [Bryobacteraceae bacterium]
MKARQVLEDPGYPHLKAEIIAATGMNYYEDRDSEVAERIGRRLAATGAPNCTFYETLLKQSARGREEMDALIAEFTIGETYFFRHREQFDLLRTTVFPELLERRRASRKLRIWSAGCATGAEPYSISILLRLHFAEQIAGWDISILGTDINRAFLARAQEGIYEKWAFREGSHDLVERCFKPVGEHRWALRTEFREGVSFRYQNLVADLPPSGPDGDRFDLVLCRNVLIYFDRPRMREVAAGLYDSLADGGWLVVGHAEPSAEVFRAFSTVSIAGGITAYRKLEDEAIESPQTLAPPQEPEAVTFFPVVELPPAPEPAIASLPPSPAQPVRIEEVRGLADRGHWQEAALKCRSILTSNGLDPAAHFTLALILEHTGDVREAERSLRAAVYLDRGFALAHYHLGLLLHRRRAAREALRAFQNVLELLAAVPAEQLVEHGDGITATELRELARVHLELLGAV